MYNIMCRVSGGVTGTREALLKDGDSSVPKVFTDLEEAQRMVSRLNRTMNNEYSTASFNYWVVLVEGR
jgi:hypothetical protein